jgi:hypothetical protein
VFLPFENVGQPLLCFNQLPFPFSPLFLPFYCPPVDVVLLF